MCVGKRIAQMEMEIVIAKLIRNFKIEWHGPDLRFKLNPINVPEDPVIFKFIDV